jgi:hypothetical protein
MSGKQNRRGDKITANHGKRAVVKWRGEKGQDKDVKIIGIGRGNLRGKGVIS